MIHFAAFIGFLVLAAVFVGNLYEITIGRSEDRHFGLFITIVCGIGTCGVLLLLIR